jgi:hypothetical protein
MAQEMLVGSGMRTRSLSRCVGPAVFTVEAERGFFVLLIVVDAVSQSCMVSAILLADSAAGCHMPPSGLLRLTALSPVPKHFACG